MDCFEKDFISWLWRGGGGEGVDPLLATVPVARIVEVRWFTTCWKFMVTYTMLIRSDARVCLYPTQDGCHAGNSSYCSCRVDVVMLATAFLLRRKCRLLHWNEGLKCVATPIQYTIFHVCSFQFRIPHYLWHSFVAGKAVTQHTCGGAEGRGDIAPTHSQHRH
jgi:hypothetical protein